MSPVGGCRYSTMRLVGRGKSPTDPKNTHRPESQHLSATELSKFSFPFSGVAGRSSSKGAVGGNTSLPENVVEALRRANA